MLKAFEAVEATIDMYFFIRYSKDDLTIPSNDGATIHYSRFHAINLLISFNITK